MPTFVEILRRWAYEHYPIEILEQIEATIIHSEDGTPTEVTLDENIFNVADPAFFQDLEMALFRRWGLRACKKPFRTCEYVQT